MGWQKVETKPTVDSAGFFSFRPWQRECFNQLKDTSRSLINAPMASGKSFCISALTAHKLRQNKNLWAIIAVPQTIIADGFFAKIAFDDGTKAEFVPQHNFCQKSATSNAKAIAELIAKPGDEKQQQFQSWCRQLRPSENAKRRCNLCSQVAFLFIRPDRFDFCCEFDNSSKAEYEFAERDDETSESARAVQTCDEPRMESQRRCVRL